jgi:hypothetical protein
MYTTHSKVAFPVLTRPKLPEKTRPRTSSVTISGQAIGSHKKLKS